MVVGNEYYSNVCKFRIGNTRVTTKSDDDDDISEEHDTASDNIFLLRVLIHTQ